MSPPSSVSRTGEYAERGDYHRNLSSDWEFYPTYLAKLAAVRAYLSALPHETRVLDAGCGEGVLVEEFKSRLAIVGVDPNYQSDLVTHGVAGAPALRRRLVRSRLVPRRPRASDVPRARRRAGRAVSRRQVRR